MRMIISEVAPADLHEDNKSKLNRESGVEWRRVDTNDIIA